MHEIRAEARIDTLGFSMPALGCQREGAEFRATALGTAAEVSTYRHPLPSGGFVSTLFRPGGHAVAWLEASIPNRVGSNNIEASDVSTVLWQAGRMVKEAKEVVAFHDSGRLRDARIVRVDGVRDFSDVEHIPELLDGLSAVPRSSVMKTRRWADAQRNCAESLRCGPKAWGGTGYDKHAESGGVAPVGRFRFESRLHAAQLASKWASSAGFAMGVLRDLTGEKVQAMTRATFERVAFDREVVGIGSLRRRVWSLDLSVSKKATLWAYLTVPGVAGEMNRNLEREYRRLAVLVGAVPGVELEDRPDVRVRLDFDSGSEIYRVAS